MLGLNFLFEKGHAAIFVETGIFVKQLKHEPRSWQNSVVSPIMGVNVRDGGFKRMAELFTNFERGISVRRGQISPRAFPSEKVVVVQVLLNVEVGKEATVQLFETTPWRVFG